MLVWTEGILIFPCNIYDSEVKGREQQCYLCRRAFNKEKKINFTKAARNTHSFILITLR